MEGLFAKELVDLGPWGLDPSAPPPPLTRVQGANVRQLRREIRLLCPSKPGVYGMVDAAGELIYVGKAKHLRARLFSYFRSRGRPPKAGKILKQSRTIVWEVCHSEFAALNRELELIRRWRPRCNVQGQPLRRRLTFLCVGRRPAPYLYLTQKPARTAQAIYGPLPAGPRLREAVRGLSDLLRLRDCPQAQDMIFPEQGELFPIVHPAGCLRFEIGTCLGPCTGTCTEPDYQRAVQAARAFLTGRDVSLLQQLTDDMHAAAIAQRFERAADLRDRLDVLGWLNRRLEQLRDARTKMSFIYPVRCWDHKTWWFFIHGGRVLAACPAPHDADTRDLAERKIREVYESKKLAMLLDSYEHVDGRLLATTWFAKYPAERKKALQPAAAAAMCR